MEIGTEAPPSFVVTQTNNTELVAVTVSPVHWRGLDEDKNSKPVSGYDVIAHAMISDISVPAVKAGNN